MNRRKRVLVQPGDKFNKLTAIRYSHLGKGGRRYFLFICDCGNETTITAGSVTGGNTKSCGCISKLLPNNEGAINQIILQYKKHAKNRGFKFLLTYEAVKEIINSPCYYCGITNSNTYRSPSYKKGFTYNGIDRIDSLGDYSTGNIVPCCNFCNRSKSDMQEYEFIEHITRIAKYQEII